MEIQGGGTYGLTDPRNGYIKYVGISGAIRFRYYDHCRIGASKKDTPLGNWLKELFDLGLKPGLIILEEQLEEKGYRLTQSEKFWIDYLKMLGAELLNIRGLMKEDIYNQDWYDKYRTGRGLPLKPYKKVA